MAFTSFIPSIWGSEILFSFQESTVAAALCNRSYEGDARVGNTVKVNTAGALTITDYAAAGRQTTAEAIASTSVDLLVNQEKSFDFLVDDIDRAQAAGSLSGYTEAAGMGLAEDSDAYILATISGSVTHQTAATLTTGAEAFDILRDLRKVLNKAHVPQAQRVAIVNAEFEAILLGSDSKLTAVNTSGSPAGLRDAAVGRILGFDIYTSENLPVTAKPQVVSWYRPAAAYVSQVNETEALRDNDSFSDRIRGLHVYGAKVVRTTGVAAWTSS